MNSLHEKLEDTSSNVPMNRSVARFSELDPGGGGLWGSVRQINELKPHQLEKVLEGFKASCIGVGFPCGFPSNRPKTATLKEQHTRTQRDI